MKVIDVNSVSLKEARIFNVLWAFICIFLHKAPILIFVKIAEHKAKLSQATRNSLLM